MARHLTQEQITELHRLVVSMGLANHAVLDACAGALTRDVAAQLTYASQPSTRLLGVLNELNQGAREPFSDWLESMLTLAALFEDAAKLREITRSLLKDGPPRDVVLAGMPWPTERLVGRDAELATLDEALSGDRDRLCAMVVGVKGLGGVGKTLLAQTYVLRSLSRYRGGTFWANAGTNRDEGERATSVNRDAVFASTLERWATALGLTAPKEIGALTELVKQRLQERQASKGSCLIVLDNVDDASLLSRFANHFGFARMLVTSRKEPLVDDVATVRIDLDGLAKSESLALWKSITEVEPNENDVGPLIKHVGGHPLAVRLLAKIAKREPELTSTALLARLTEGSKSATRADVELWRPTSLGDCFRLSVAHVKTQRGQWPLLVSMASQSPLGCSLDCADYVSGVVDRERTRRMLAALDDEGLVSTLRETHASEPRYALHRLLRDWLREYDEPRVGPIFSRRSWELPSAAWALARLSPDSSAGSVTYDARLELWAWKRIAQRGAAGLDTLDREALLASVFAHAESDRSLTAIGRLAMIRANLAGADLAPIKEVPPVFLDGANLEGARLDGVHFKGRPPRWSPSWSQWWQYNRRLFVGSVPLVGLTTLLFYESCRTTAPALAFVPVTCVGPFLGFRIVVGTLLSGGAVAAHGREAHQSFIEPALGVVLGATLALILTITSVTPTSSAQVFGLLVALPPLITSLDRTIHRIRRTVGAAVGRLIVSSGTGAALAVALWGVSISPLVEWDGVFSLLFMFAVAACILPAYLFFIDPDVPWVPISCVRVYLRRARLDRASLRGARLDATSLRDASLRDADLTDATLDRVDLRGADLTGATLANTTLRDVVHDASTRWPDGKPPPSIV